jgi:hypothetical protein
LARWFPIRNHIHYAKWIQVHLNGVTELSGRHPEVLGIGMFREDCFKVQKTTVFIWFPVDKAHKRNKTCIRETGRAVGGMIIHLLSGVG